MYVYLEYILNVEIKLARNEMEWNGIYVSKYGNSSDGDNSKSYVKCSYLIFSPKHLIPDDNKGLLPLYIDKGKFPRFQIS